MAFFTCERALECLGPALAGATAANMRARVAIFI